MSDNIEVKALLTADDEASPVIRGLLRSLRRLEKASFGTPNASKLLSTLTGAGAVASRMADAQIRQARALGVTAKAETTRARAASLAGADLRKRMVFENRMLRQRAGEERRAARDAASALRSETAAKMRSARLSVAAAVRADALQFRALKSKLAFGARMERQRAAETREQERIENRRAAAHRRELAAIDREGRARRRAFMTTGRTTTNAMRDAGTGVGTAAMVGTSAVAGGGYMIARRESEADASEINARIYGGLSATQARDTRRWARVTGVDVGMREAALLTQYVDVLKLGLADADAKKVAVLNQKLAEGFQISPEEVSVVTGKQIAAQISNGDKFDFQKVYGVANAIQHIAAETATDPRELLQFGFRSVGGAKALGMDPRFAMAFGAAGIQQGVQPFAMAETLDFIGSRIPQLAEFERQNGIEGQRTRKLLRSLGYGSVTGMNRAKARDPNRFVYDLHERFAKIQNPERRNEALTAFYGADRFSEGAAISNSMPAFKRAMDLAEASKRIDAIESMWSLHTTKLAFIGRQIDSAFGGLLGSLGELVGPGLKDIGKRLTTWISGNTKSIQVAFYAGMQGLASGLLGRDGTVRDLVDSMFGGRGIASNPQKVHEFFRGLGDGLRDIWSALRWIGEAAKSFLQAVGPGSAEDAGRFAAKLLGIGVAARVTAPWVAVAKDAAVAIGASVLTIAGVAKLVGGGAAVAGAGAALGAAAIPVMVAGAAVALAVTVANWSELREWFTGIFGKPGWTTRRAENDVARSRGEGKDFVDGFLERWFGGAFGRRGGGVSGGGGDASVRGYPAQDRLTGADLGGALQPMGGTANKDVLGAIMRAEGTAGADPFNVVLGHGRYGKPSKPLTSMTLDEAEAFGNQVRARHGSSSALGAFQIVNSTRRDAAKALGLDMATTRYTPDVQRQMAGWILQQQGLQAWTGFRSNPAELATAKGAMAGVPLITGASAAGQAGAADAMTPYLGMTETGAGRSDINRFMRASGFNIDAAKTAWCAGFVGSALKSVGLKGTGSLTASSYLSWGEKIDPSKVMRGDVLVEGRGRRPGETGAHVGLATGNTRQGKNGLEVEMISGNSGGPRAGGGAVQHTWEPASTLAVRRAAGQVPTASSVASAVPSSALHAGGGAGGRGGGQGGGSGGVSIGTIHVNGTDKSPREIAEAVGREFANRSRWTTGDIAYDD